MAAPTRTALRRLNLRRAVLVFVLGLVAWAIVPDLLFRPSRNPDYGLLLAANSPSTSRFAFATFLSGDADVAALHDDYFRAVRLLAYQLLHADQTRTRAGIPLVVLVTKGVPQWKRDRLARDGATVIEAEDVPLNWWIGTGVTRWKDQFTKLRLLEMTQYDRMLFIDADTLLTRPLDGVFEVTNGVRDPSRTLFDERPRQVRWDEARLPAAYVFAARSDNQLLGERAHEFPPGHTDVFTAGFWVAAPSRELYVYLMSVMSHWRRFDPHTMEQSLLNYAFRRVGPMPWTELDPAWSATWPNDGDLAAGVASLHEKFWKTGPPKLRDLYEAKRAEAEKFFDTRDKGHEY